jgi:predicted nucleotidyltransferase component of viral defense system
MTLLTDKKIKPFFKEAKLLLEVMPAIADESCFALKGGTALNFFVRDMPRLSVDIDLTYLPISDRESTLNAISSALKSITKKILQANPLLLVQEGKIKNTNFVTKLYISNSEVQIKVEPNVVIRGTLFPTEMKRVSTKVQELFEVSVKTSIVSMADLYGGKICAALDRQHPRDLFDVKILFENEGITKDIRKGFLIYLASHKETMNQLLDPQLKDITIEFRDEFLEMPTQPVTLEELLETRKSLIKIIQKILTKDERKFLLTLKEGVPDWDLLGVPGAEKLPAIQWKLMNIRKMDPLHHKKSIERLKVLLKM